MKTRLRMFELLFSVSETAHLVIILLWTMTSPKLRMLKTQSFQTRFRFFQQYNRRFSFYSRPVKKWEKIEVYQSNFWCIIVVPVLTFLFSLSFEKSLRSHVQEWPVTTD